MLSNAFRTAATAQVGGAEQVDRVEQVVDRGLGAPASAPITVRPLVVYVFLLSA